jgi:hypothetical protein
MLKCHFEDSYSLNTTTNAFRAACRNANVNFSLGVINTYVLPSTSTTSVSEATFNLGSTYKVVDFFNKDKSEINYIDLQKLNLNYGLLWIQIVNSETLNTKNTINQFFAFEIDDAFKAAKLPYSIALNYFIPEYNKLITSRSINLADQTLSFINAFTFDDDAINTLLATLFNSTHKSLDIYTFITFTANN